MKFSVKSATYAMKGKQLLQQEGIRVSVGKSSGPNGCFYYLRVSERNAIIAEQVLSENGILRI